MRHLGAFFCIVMALLATATSALAQDLRWLDVRTTLYCGEALSGDGTVFSTITISGNENHMPASEQSFSIFVGPQDFKISVTNVYDDREAKTAIREIAVIDPSGTQRTVIATPNSREASFNYAVPGPAAAADGFAFDVKVDECAGKTKLKIATTSSCRGLDGEDFIIQPQVAVMIGGREFTSNDKGIIEAEVPLGKYEITAQWFDAGLSYVKHDGGQAPKTEDGKPIVTLTKDAETFEVRMATCDASGATKVRGTLTELTGSARFAGGKKAGRALTPGQAMVDGDVVVINGNAVVTWGDGHVVRFEGGPGGSGIIIVGADRPTPKGTKAPSGVNKIRLIRGLIRFLDPTIPNEEIWKFETSSDAVVVEDKGTEFTFSHDEATVTTTVTLLEGAITLTPTNPALAPFDLKPGESVTVTTTAVSAITKAGGWGTKVKPAHAFPQHAAGDYLGCFADTSVFDLDGFLERSGTNTPSNCVATCAAKGFAYAGVQYGESCLCGDSYGRYGEASNCDFQCTGAPGEICGGYNANSIYATGN